MMMRSPGCAPAEALVADFLLLAPFAELDLAVDVLAGGLLAVDLLAVVFSALVFLAVALLAGTVCLPTASVVSAYFFGSKRGLRKDPVAVPLQPKAVRLAQDVESVTCAILRG
jgi:hypothetical protein